MNDDLVEVGILLLELLESLLLVYLENLLLDSLPRPFILLSLLLQVLVNHVLKRGFRLDGANLGESPYDHIFELIFEAPCFLLGFFVHLCAHEMFGHIHDIVKRIRLIFLDGVLFEL